MPRKKKPRKAARSRGKGTHVILSEEEAVELLSAHTNLSSPEETKVYETPCGTYRINDSAGELNIKSNILKGKLAELAAGDVIKSDMDVIIEFEKLKVRHPKEPYLYRTVASSYKTIDQEKYRAELRKNYELFPDYPRIAMTYGAMFGHELSTEEKRAVVGFDTDLHNRFPKYKFFDMETVVNFLSVHNYLALEAKDFEQAEKCALSVAAVEPRTGKMMLTNVKMKSDPAFKRKFFVQSAFLILFILGIAVAIIYGIVRFFQWIF